jgi:hypothetical protein
MKALSIRQPWAWEIVQGIKVVEFRSWPINVSEPFSFYVHAPQTVEEERLAEERSWLAQHGVVLPDDLPTGGIVGMATLVECVQRVEPSLWRQVTDEVRNRRLPPGVAPERDSKWFGDAYGFVLRDARPLPFKELPGRLKFFNVADDLYGPEVSV